MSEFSAEWLELREAADVRARNSDIADAIAARFTLRDELSVLDLGAGTGANLRALAPLLPERQSWTLAEKDADLRSAAVEKLASWADVARHDDDRLLLQKDRRTITVVFADVDLATETDDLITTAKPQFVAASAFFDLASESYIRSLVRSVAALRAAFFAGLTYSGLHRWTPHRPADNRMAAAFHRHQMRDKGFGPAAGPSASGFLADQFRLSGYLVLEGESPWQLDKSDRMLIGELVRGHALAVREAGGVDDKTIVDWVNVQRTAASIGHTDLFAVPA